MTLFCYGILLHVLNLCSPRKTTQKFLCGTMFLSINPNYDIRDDDGTVGHLKNCSNEISPSITDVIDSADVEAIRTCFEKQIIPKLYPNEVSTAIAALAHIVANADNIEKNVRIGTLSEMTKADYANITEVEPAAFLTDLLIFSVKAIDNKQGETFYRTIEKRDRFNRLPFDASKIKLKKPEKDHDPVLTATLRKKNFDRAFEPISQNSIGLQNDNEIRIYRLRSEDYDFSDARIRRFITDNIGRYVFSRAQIERFRESDDDDEQETLGLEAAQYWREHIGGNEFGEFMIYAFLEAVLDAPKLFSRLELTTDLGVSDGIHLKRRSGSLEYQLVYGASDIQGDLKKAVDAAVKRVKEIKEAKPSPYQIVNSASYYQSVPDEQMAEAIRRIIFPSKKNEQPPPTAFGIFLGYTLKMTDDDYLLPLPQFKKKMAQQLEREIVECASYIKSELTKLRLHQHSYYVYVLPLNNADDDKHSIIRKLIGGNA